MISQPLSFTFDQIDPEVGHLNLPENIQSFDDWYERQMVNAIDLWLENQEYALKKPPKMILVNGFHIYD